MGLFPQTQVLPACACSHADRKDFFNYIWLVNKADDAPFESPKGGEPVEPHVPLAFGAGQRVCFVDFSDEVGPAL